MPVAHFPKILVVEAEDALALALQTHLRQAGYAPERCVDAGRAVARAVELQPALVLLNGQQGGVSGYQICQDLRAERGADAVKILMLTAAGSEIERRRALALGADDILAKPFSPEALTAAIARVLAARKGAAGSADG